MNLKGKYQRTQTKNGETEANWYSDVSLSFLFVCHLETNKEWKDWIHLVVLCYEPFVPSICLWTVIHYKTMPFISKAIYVNHNCLDNEIFYGDDVPSVCFLTEDCGLGITFLCIKSNSWGFFKIFFTHCVWKWKCSPPSADLKVAVTCTCVLFLSAQLPENSLKFF